MNILRGAFCGGHSGKKKKIEERRKKQNSCQAKSLEITPGSLGLFLLRSLLWDPQCDLRGSLKNQIAVDGSAMFEPARC